MSQTSHCGSGSHETRVKSHCSIHGQDRCFVFVNLTDLLKWRRCLSIPDSAFRAATITSPDAPRPFGHNPPVSSLLHTS